MHQVNYAQIKKIFTAKKDAIKSNYDKLDEQAHAKMQQLKDQQLTYDLDQFRQLDARRYQWKLFSLLNPLSARLAARLEKAHSEKSIKGKVLRSTDLTLMPIHGSNDMNFYTLEKGINAERFNNFVKRFDPTAVQLAESTYGGNLLSEYVSCFHPALDDRMDTAVPWQADFKKYEKLQKEASKHNFFKFLHELLGPQHPGDDPTQKPKAKYALLLSPILLHAAEVVRPRGWSRTHIGIPRRVKPKHIMGIIIHSKLSDLEKETLLNQATIHQLPLYEYSSDNGTEKIELTWPQRKIIK